MSNLLPQLVTTVTEGQAPVWLWGKLTASLLLEPSGHLAVSTNAGKQGNMWEEFWHSQWDPSMHTKFMYIFYYHYILCILQLTILNLLCAHSLVMILS